MGLRWPSFAVEAWREGAGGGGWEGLLALLADGVEVTMPFKDRWRGAKVGREEAAELFRHASQDLAIRLEQTPASPLIGDGTTFAVELLGRGTVNGVAATVPICLWLTVADGRLVAIREYLGDPA